MANRWKGNFVIATAATSDGTAYTGKANGAWGLNSQLQQKQGSLWAKGVGVPSAPTIGTAVGGNNQATIPFTGSSDTGGGTLTYTATSTPSNITNSSATSPIIITGLTNGTAYTFTVRATNSLGYSSVESNASNSVTPNPIGATSFMAIAGNLGSPAMAVYPWSNSTGAGVKYNNPSVLTASATDITFNNFQNVGNAIFVSNTSSPYIGGYTWVGTGDSANFGFGNKLSDPATLPTNTVTRIDINTTGNCLGVAQNADPRFLIYGVSSAGFSSVFSNPSLVTNDRVMGSGFNLSDNLIGLGGYNTTSGSSFIYVYNWSNTSGFGSKYINPTSMPAGLGKSIVFTNTNSAVFVAHDNAPNITAYAWSNGFGTKYANPSIEPGGDGSQVAWDNVNSKIAVAFQASPFIHLYDWSAGFGTKVADPATIPSGNGLGVTFNYSNNVIAVSAANALPAIYPWSNSGFGSKYTDITGAPYGNSYGKIAFTGV